MKYIIISFLLVNTFLFSGCKEKTLFSKIGSEISYVDFVNKITPNDTLNAFTFTNFYNGAGVGIGDFNNDSLPDLFFTANQVSSKIYINKGDLRFLDVSETAGITTSSWCTGVSIVDINQDGWDDIYVSTAKHPSFKNSKNLLFINQKTSHPTFKEEAEKYGLAFDGFTTQTVFFDYDLDGDLDAFLLNSSPDLQNPNYLRPSINDGSYPSTDRLFKNEGMDSNGQITFSDVSLQAGITFEGLGLGVVVSDINDDGYPDIYCSNDFISSDILYVNNKNGTFSNIIKSATAHTSLFGMGVDAADLTNDSKIDIFQLDMLPEDNFRQKQMLIGQDYDRKQMSISNNYQYQLQYMRNMLQINSGNDPKTGEPQFSEVGLMSNLARTDWSWATLLADLDNDGKKDVFISNGYRKNITDRDFINYAEEYNFFGTDKARHIKRDELLSKVPEIELKNYAFKNLGSFSFENVSKTWGLDEAGFSNGAAWADLDNDGDLDLIVNNIDSKASLFINNSKKEGANFINFKPIGPVGNIKGIGLTSTIWMAGQPQKVENYVVRGYASSVASSIHFGTGSFSKVDSVIFKWPGGKVQKLFNLKTNNSYPVYYKNAELKSEIAPALTIPYFTASKLNGVDFQHNESDYIDFKQTATRHKMLSRLGFVLKVADINNDGLDDFMVGGSYNGSESCLYIQTPDHSFKYQSFPETNGREVGDILFFDADGDGDVDLLLTYSSNERPLNVIEAYQPQLFINNGNANFSLAPNSLPKISVSSTSAIAIDIDQDGRQDILITSRQVPGKYPLHGQNYVLLNNSKSKEVTFKDVSLSIGKNIMNIGMVSQVISTKLDVDRFPDLVFVGEWMPITMFVNENGKGFKAFAKDALKNTSGWWNCIAAHDINKDGLVDFIIGNEGLNSFYKASAEFPVRIVAKDFNDDGSFDPIMGQYILDDTYPVHARDALNQQIIQFRKKYQRYANYAKATFKDLFSDMELKDAYQNKATELKSIVLMNNGNENFAIKPLPSIAQIAPIFGIIPMKVNQDNFIDLVITGNFYPNEVHMGRQDASRGLVLLGKGNGEFEPMDRKEAGFNIVGDARASSLLHAGDYSYILTAINSKGLSVYEKSDKK